MLVGVVLVGILILMILPYAKAYYFVFKADEKNIQESATHIFIGTVITQFEDKIIRLPAQQRFEVRTEWTKPYMRKGTYPGIVIISNPFPEKNKIIPGEVYVFRTIYDKIRNRYIVMKANAYRAPHDF